MESDEDDTMEPEADNLQVIEDEASNDSGVSNLKPTNQRASAWKHFDEIIENGVKYAKCKHCTK